ncbi:Uma2 family endonuclease [Desulfococcaceae bacterium HSG8]|nr:Uma2 family endonuclease [Desulfococcaceae bacterium HSG8]
MEALKFQDDVIQEEECGPGFPEESEDGRAVSEEEYWEKYYNHPGEYVYEWSRGCLEEKPMSDLDGSEIYQWFCDILRCYLQTYPIGRITNLEIGFPVVPSGRRGVRRPDLAVVLNSNSLPIKGEDCSYSGVFDLCVESLSYSSLKEIKRDTFDKKREYEATGVKEYHILDARGKETVSYHRGKRGKYLKIKPVKGDIIRSVVLAGFQFRIPDLYQQPGLEELSQDPVYQDFVLPSFREVRKEMASEKERAEKEKRRAEEAEKNLSSEKLRAEKQFAETARRMLSDGLDISAVMRYTGMSADKLAALKHEI